MSGYSDDPRDRPPDNFGGTTTIYSGGGHPSYVFLPTVPAGAIGITSSGGSGYGMSLQNFP